MCINAEEAKGGDKPINNNEDDKLFSSLSVFVLDAQQEVNWLQIYLWHDFHRLQTLFNFSHDCFAYS